MYLDRTYYQFKTEIDFPRLHINCESAEEEKLDDTIPYKEPPPPYHAIRIIEPIDDTQSEQHGPLQALDNRLDPSYQQSQVPSQNIPQLDGPSDRSEQYISAATSPSQWREYPLSSAGSQVANWDSTGDHLYNTQSSVGDIQHRHIDYSQEITSNCNDGLHCTNPPACT